MTHSLRRLLMSVVGLGFAAAACGDADTTVTSGTPDDLDDRSFWSVSITEDGAPRDLVAETRIQLTFRATELGASAGCNSIGGPFTIDGTTLVAESFGMTEMGCDPERHAQDDFVAGFLSSRPTITLDGDRLVLTSDSVTIEFLDREVADPDRSVTGTRWTITGFIQGQVAMAMAVPEDGWIEIVDSTMRGDDGCGGFTAAVEYSDGGTGGPVGGDGEMQFGSRDPAAPTADCPSQAYTDAFNELFATGDATIELRGPNMTLLNRDGNGVTFRAAE